MTINSNHLLQASLELMGIMVVDLRIPVPQSQEGSWPINTAYYAAGNQAKAMSQMLLVVLKNQNAEIRQRTRMVPVSQTHRLLRYSSISPFFKYINNFYIFLNIYIYIDYIYIKNLYKKENIHFLKFKTYIKYIYIYIYFFFILDIIPWYGPIQDSIIHFFSFIHTCFPGRANIIKV